MSESNELKTRLLERFPHCTLIEDTHSHELALEVPAVQLLEVAGALRGEPAFSFEQLIDLCGVDYLHYGLSEWTGANSTHTGYSRGVHYLDGDDRADMEHRFAVAYQLLSLKHNWRLRLRAYPQEEDFPALPSVIDIWPCANWFEREAFDLYGILFEGHPDLRRILTDYGFVGHPFRKDFPLSGEVEVRYDPEKQRVVYQPVSIERRVLVPKIVRKDHRFNEELLEPRPGDLHEAFLKTESGDA